MAFMGEEINGVAVEAESRLHGDFGASVQARALMVLLSPPEPARTLFTLIILLLLFLGSLESLQP